jgi:hypothetical protein
MKLTKVYYSFNIFHNKLVTEYLEQVRFSSDIYRILVVVLEDF